MLLRRLLLLPLLSPLLAALLVGALNPRPPVSLRLLTWSSPPLPIGVWMAAAAATGAALSGGATALAISEASGVLRRRVHRRPGSPSVSAGEARGDEAWEAFPRRSGAGTAVGGEPRTEAVKVPAGWGTGPSRAPGEPAPTVAVPFRVLRRGEGMAAPAQASPRQQEEQVVPGRVPRHEEPVAVAADDWGAAERDDW